MAPVAMMRKTRHIYIHTHTHTEFGIEVGWSLYSRTVHTVH